MCDDYFGMDEAHVICQQLDCGRALSVLDEAYFGRGYGPIWMDDIFCSGKESSITECAHAGFANQDCSHGEDVGVVCEGNVLIGAVS